MGEKYKPWRDKTKTEKQGEKRRGRVFWDSDATGTYVGIDKLKKAIEEQKNK